MEFSKIPLQIFICLMENGSLNYSDRFAFGGWINISGSQEVVACTFRWWTWINFPVPISLSSSKLIQHISRKSWILACTSPKAFSFYALEDEAKEKLSISLRYFYNFLVLVELPSWDLCRLVNLAAKHLRRLMISVRVVKVFLLLLINRLSSEKQI